MAKCQECQRGEVYVHFGEEELCLKCYNGRMEELFGVAATSYPEGVTIRDGEGEIHHFHIRKRMDPLGIFMEAEEMSEGGYDFKLQGDLYADQGELFLQLIAKAERGMTEKYVEQGTFPDGQSYSSLRDDRLAGRVESDLTENRMPVISVDGRFYTWDEIGRMLMHYEGFQLKLEMVDPYGEIEWEDNEQEKEQEQ